MSRIIGIMLVKDEDLYVEQAIYNVLGFCDELILADNGSRDGTLAILERVAREAPIPITLERITNPAVSHDLIKGYAGEDVWVFGVDGDELYDRARLDAFKARVLSGEFRDDWQLKGNVLHCTEIASDRSTATGYLAPPSPSMTKLFNFRIIESWEGETPERLHGPVITFREGHQFSQLMLNRQHSWDDSPFRCLHLTFVPRSTRDKPGIPRRNVKDIGSPRRLPLRLWSRLQTAAGFPERSQWKLEHYRHGDPVTVSATPFFTSSSGR